MDCAAAALDTPTPLFEADRLLRALRAIQLNLQFMGNGNLAMSEDFVAFFNHLLSRICHEVVVRVGGGETFEAAVKAILDGQLATHAVTEGDKWSMDNPRSPQVVDLFEKVRWPAKLKSQVCGLADYLMAEIMEVSLDAVYDDRGRVLGSCCRRDTRLLFQMTQAARNEASLASEEAVQALLRRYQQFPLLLVGRAISADEELAALCKKIFGEEVDLWMHVPKQPPEASSFASAAGCRAQWSQWREDHRVSTDAWLSNGLGARPLPVNERFPTPEQLDVLKTFCMGYDAVDQNGLREADQPAADCAEGGGGVMCLEPEVLDSFKSQLHMVRRAVRPPSEGAAGAVVELHLDENYLQGGCDLLQLVGAVAFQVAAGNISKVSCVWPTDDDEATDLADFMQEVLGDIFDQTCYPEPTHEGLAVEMYGESYTTCYVTGNAVLHKLAYMNDAKRLRKLGPKYDVEDSFQGDSSGLHDEDTVGEYKPLHVAAYEGHLEAFCVLTDELNANLDSRAFDNATPLLVAVSRGRLSIVEACVERRAKLDTQIFKEPGWQSNMMSTAGFSAVHMAVNCQSDEILERLLDAGAAASLYTGPLASGDFPIGVERMTDVYEYDRHGHRYTPLHLASLVDNPIAVSALLKGGRERRTRADVDERVQSGFRDDVEYYLAEDGRRSAQIVLSMSTAMHLSTPGSVVAATLAQAGANLLAQNFELQLAGERLSLGQLGQWVWSQAQGRETALLLQRKKVPPSVENCILKHVVELHLAEQFDQAMAAELLPHHVPLMAVALVGDEQWEAESESIAKHFADNHYYATLTGSGGGAPQEEFSQFVLWVRGLLEESKRTKMAGLAAQIATHIKTM